MTPSINTTSINQTLISSKAISGSAVKTRSEVVPARVVRHLARKWDLYGVISLLASCTAYGAFALAHVA